MSHAVLGLDIGGANLKAAHSGGTARLQPFALWKDPGGLPDALRRLIAGMPAFDQLAVTMTGELCDCFETKRAGVSAILDAVAAAAGHTPVRVWRTDGRFVSIDEARRTPLLTAASNWLALATFAGRYAPKGPGLVIDIGSTTTDIVPLNDGRPVPRGRTDPERFRCSELVYTGVRRTPLCAVLSGFDTAKELFATTLDAYLVLGNVPEDETDRDTADGRPATRAAAHARLARMLCADLETSTEHERHKLAELVKHSQLLFLGLTLWQVAIRSGGPRTAVLAGSGEWLAEEALKRAKESQAFVVKDKKPFASCEVVSLARQLGPEISCAACAYALAVLAVEGSTDKVPVPTVVKIGGSLFDLPDLGPRLRRWLDALPRREVLLVPGGGATADVIRALDRTHQFGEEKAHWLALRGLGLHAHFLAALLPDAAVVEHPDACPAVWQAGQVAVLDAHAFARADEPRPGHLPHSWDATSDSLAARVAVVANARLVLLKSETIPEGIDWAEAARRGFVDPLFADVVSPLDEVRAVNFRTWGR